MKHRQARKVIHDRIESRRLIRYYINIHKIILIQTRIRMFLSKRRLAEAIEAERDAAAYMIQQCVVRFLHKRRKESYTANLIKYFIIKSIVSYKFNIYKDVSFLFLSIRTRRILKFLLNSISIQNNRKIINIQRIIRPIVQRIVHNKRQTQINHYAANILINFIKMTGPRHKFKIHMLMTKRAKRIISTAGRNFLIARRNARERLEINSPLSSVSPEHPSPTTTINQISRHHNPTELDNFNRIFRENMAQVENYIATRHERHARQQHISTTHNEIMSRLNELQSIYSRPRATNTPTLPRTPSPPTLPRTSTPSRTPTSISSIRTNINTSLSSLPRIPSVPPMPHIPPLLEHLEHHKEQQSQLIQQNLQQLQQEQQQQWQLLVNIIVEQVILQEQYHQLNLE